MQQLANDEFASDQGVGAHGGDDDGGPDPEACVEVLIVIENEGGEKHAVNGLEIAGEVDGENGEAFEEGDVLREGDDGAENGEEEEPEPVEGCRFEDGPGVVEKDKHPGEGSRAQHFVGGDDKVVSFLDVKAVDDGEDGGEEGGEKGDEEALAELEFTLIDGGNSNRNDDTEGEINRAEFSAPNHEWFQDGGPKGQGGDPGHADGDVGDFDGEEEGNPVRSDDRTGEREFEALPRRDEEFALLPNDEENRGDGSSVENKAVG